MVVSATWPLAPAPTPPSPTPPSVSGVGIATIPAGARVYLGTCVLRPFRRDEKNDFANDSGAALVAASVVQVLGTICDSGATRGELPWRTEFGSVIELLRHRNANEILEDLANIYVFEALQRWEPRAIVRDTQMLSEIIEGEAHVTLRVIFDVAATNTPGSEIVARDLSVSLAL